MDTDTADTPTGINVMSIDLGFHTCKTTVGNSLNPNRTMKSVENEIGSATTHSYVAFKSDERFIGDQAYTQPATNGCNIVPEIPQLLGLSMDDFEADRDGRFRYFWPTVAPSEVGSKTLNVAVEYNEASMNLYPEQLLAMLLHKLYSDALKYLNPIDKVVITVPQNYGFHQLQALTYAAQIVKLPETKICWALDAMATYYGTKHTVEQPRQVFFLDIGHRSISTSIVRFEESSGHIVTRQSIPLGVGHFDDRLFDSCCQEILEKYKVVVQPRSKLGLRLLRGCERAKIQLSTMDFTDFVVENVVDGVDYKKVVTRVELEKLCSAELQELRRVISETLSVAGLSANDIDAVESVGGGCRSPIVNNVIAEIFSAEKLCRTMDSTSAVSIGGAILACNGLPMEPNSRTYFVEDSPKLEIPPSPQVDAWTEQELQFQRQDEAIAKVHHAKNELESYIYEMRRVSNEPNYAKFFPASCQEDISTADNWLMDEGDSANYDTLHNYFVELKRKIETSAPEYFVQIQKEKEEAEKRALEEALRWQAERAASGDSVDHDNRRLKKADRMKLVVSNKEEANDFFKASNYQDAVRRYIKALQHCDKFFDLSEDDKKEVNQHRMTLYLNLAQCYLKLDAWPKVISNCESALVIDPKNVKALYRRARAYDATKDYEKAAADLKIALELDPKNADLINLQHRVKIQLQKIAEKEKAMARRMFS